MSNVDELCVKYVFDELDPSEIVIVEQAMIRDQNLLIEVESLKSTWRKLKKMPEVHPPQNISEAIIDQAIEHASQQQIFGSRWKNPGLLATAAVVLFSLLITTAYLLPYETHSESGSGDSQTAVMGTSASSLQNRTESDQDQFAPWIDRRNMMYLGSTGDREQNIEMDSLRNSRVRHSGNSDDSVFLQYAIPDIQMTGTQF